MSHNHSHFTGTKGGKKIRRKGLSRKERARNHGTSVNKYAHLVPKRQVIYDPVDKTFRELPVKGKPGDVIKTGFRVTFHGRLYSLIEDVMIPEILPDTPRYPGISEGENIATGKFKLVSIL